LKFLLVIRHGLYLRNYEPLVRRLAAAKHHVVIAVTDSKLVDDTLLRHLPAELPQVTVVKPPERQGWWWSANDPLRILQDYFHYFDDAYVAAPDLFARAARNVPSQARFVFERMGLGRLSSLRRVLAWWLRLVERSTPADPALTSWIEAQRPDALLVTPLVDFNYYQLDVLKAGLSLGLPSALLVASWDNLTNKGLILLTPDMVVVWNEFQRREAETMHGIPPDRIVVTGAQLFDQWFEMRPSSTREQFCARVGGLDAKQPIILYLCSSTFICKHEVAFVRRWLKALREHSDPAVQTANVIVRPHPVHASQWEGVKLSEFGNAVVWPPAGAAPLDQKRKQDYFDSLHFAAVVVGINTTGFLEAGIVGRPTLTVRTVEFAKTQEGTLHFRYLTNGGLLHLAEDLKSHADKLSELLAGSNAMEGRVRQFIKEFLRPFGADEPATPLAAEAVLRLTQIKRERRAAMPVLAPVVRGVVAPMAMALRRTYLARLKRRRVRKAEGADRAVGLTR
jgi:hypothetical protein